MWKIQIFFIYIQLVWNCFWNFTFPVYGVPKIPLLFGFFFVTLDKAPSAESACGRQMKNEQARQTWEQLKFMPVINQTITVLNEFGMVFLTPGFKEFIKGILISYQ